MELLELKKSNQRLTILAYYFQVSEEVWIDFPEKFFFYIFYWSCDLRNGFPTKLEAKNGREILRRWISTILCCVFVIVVRFLWQKLILKFPVCFQLIKTTFQLFFFSFYELFSPYNRFVLCRFHAQNIVKAPGYIFCLIPLLNTYSYKKYVFTK